MQTSGESSTSPKNRTNDSERHEDINSKMRVTKDASISVKNSARGGLLYIYAPPFSSPYDRERTFFY